MKSSKVVQQIQEVVEFLRSCVPTDIDVAIVLGSGLGNFVNDLTDCTSIPYSDIPHFEKPTVDGHEGKIYFGTLNGVRLAALQGRWHFYEGHSMSSVVLPTRALAALGAHTIILTNAAGGVNLSYETGDWMIIQDHLNLMGDNPLTGQESSLFGPRFPDMSEPYSQACIATLEEGAKKLGMPLKKGVYVGVRGPTYETPAEVKMIRALGGDAVGMSTVPEAIAARHLGMRVVGLSCITNMAAGIEKKTLDHAHVRESAAMHVRLLTQLIGLCLPEIARKPKVD